MFPGLHPMAMMATSGMGYTSRGAGYQGIYGAGPAPYPPIYQSGPPPGPGGPPPASDTSVRILKIFFKRI